MNFVVLTFVEHKGIASCIMSIVGQTSLKAFAYFNITRTAEKKGGGDWVGARPPIIVNQKHFK